jgi:hypothetical protein
VRAAIDPSQHNIMRARFCSPRADLASENVRSWWKETCWR